MSQGYPSLILTVAADNQPAYRDLLGGNAGILHVCWRRLARVTRPTDDFRAGGRSNYHTGTEAIAIEEQSMPNTVKFHRVLKSTPDRVYRAFLDPDAMAKWLPPHGFTGKVHSMDARVGGGYRMSFTNFGTVQSHSFGGTYVELTPNQRLRYTDRFDDPNLPGEMAVAVSLRQVQGGTDLTVVQEGIPAVIPVEMCYLGWQESLATLANLVEPSIP